MEIEKLVRIAYRDLPNCHRNNMAMKTFCSSLRNFALQRHLLAVHTPTRADTVRVGNDYLQIQGSKRKPARSLVRALERGSPDQVNSAETDIIG